ncbi:MAG: LemA protein [Thermoleophilaceae bacterium]|jgi:LemA protein|nr:LemA protein [Thermoleophilaceae bacterium]
MTLIYILIALVVIVVLYAVVTYNTLVRLRQSAEEGFSDIDVQLKRRHDLIPNLVETVKGYASHERQTFEAVTAARAGAVSAHGPADQGKAEGVLNQALGKLLAVAEAYPDLKANQNFLELQRELTATEDKIAASRRFYNSTVETMNTKIQQVPSNIIAGMGNFETRQFFEIETPAEREPTQVSFS